MRDVAAFFGVPLPTVFRVYGTLEQEGILTRFRSSRTMLVGETTLAREAVRGVIGLPVWLRAMVTLPYTRDLAMRLEERLREMDFVADIIFHHAKEDEKSPDFAIKT